MNRSPLDWDFIGPERAAGRTVVFLHAHPDDEALFTAAAMRRLADRGARVVLIVATSGEEGVSLLPLRAGESLAARRVHELERSCARLGVTRLKVLDHRDSGMAGSTANYDRRAFAGATSVAARQVADVLKREAADLLVHYDSTGLYAHPDHLAVHRVGRAAALLSNVPSLETTIDPRCLTRHPDHLLAQVQRSSASAGTEVWMTQPLLTVRASYREIRAKRAAMAAHASQIPHSILAGGFAATYGTEWFRAGGCTRQVDWQKPPPRKWGTGLDGPFRR